MTDGNGNYNPNGNAQSHGDGNLAVGLRDKQGWVLERSVHWRVGVSRGAETSYLRPETDRRRA